VSGVDDTMSAQERDAGVEFNITPTGDNTVRINYMVKNNAINVFLLHVNMFHVPIAGSPFTLRASHLL
jgi:hypothetical protein